MPEIVGVVAVLSLFCFPHTLWVFSIKKSTPYDCKQPRTLACFLRHSSTCYMALPSFIHIKEVPDFNKHNTAGRSRNISWQKRSSTGKWRNEKHIGQSYNIGPSHKWGIIFLFFFFYAHPTTQANSAPTFHIFPAWACYNANRFQLDSKYLSKSWGFRGNANVKLVSATIYTW